MAKKLKSPEEILFEKEGRGRFNLRKSLTTFQLRPGRGPTSVMTNLPVPGKDNSPVLPRVKLVGKLMKDAMGKDVRVFVPHKKRRSK